MTPQQALDVADALRQRQSSGLPDSDIRIVPYRTREFEDAFLFFMSAIDPVTERPKRMQPGGGSPILVRKDGSPAEGIWLYSDLSREYGLFPPEVRHVVTLSSVVNVPGTAKCLRDTLGLTLREALQTVRSVIEGRPFEACVPDAATGNRLTDGLRLCGADAVHKERPSVVPKAYLGRPWPMPDWMPRMFQRIQVYQGHLDRYLRREVGIRDHLTDFFEIENDMSDAEQIEAELTEVSARKEWGALRKGLYVTVVDLQLPFELEEPGGFQVVFEKADEDAFRAEITRVRAAMDDFVARHALTPDRPTPLA